MKDVVAVSGGVDSVVLLDILARWRPERLVVAHFDHGMRDESAADARFVQQLAAGYGLPYILRREELGAGASEATARARRYAFLTAVAAHYGGMVVTAHHLDDVVETVALNLQRGTRWRGLAALSDNRRWRPLIAWPKQVIYDYATMHRLEWVEDETNATTLYTRNRLRRRLSRLNGTERQAVYQLWRQQQALRCEIEQLLAEQEWPIDQRYFMTMVPEVVAAELLAWQIGKLTGRSLLSQQLARGLLAIRTGRAGTRWQLGAGVVLVLDRRRWWVQKLPKSDKMGRDVENLFSRKEEG